MAKKVIKKITQKTETQPEVVEESFPKEDQSLPSKAQEREQPQLSADGKKIKRCVFCTNKTNPSYTDSAALRRFVSDRAKIVSRLRSGVCTKHQRKLSKQIKYSRHLALLPFTPKV